MAADEDLSPRKHLNGIDTLAHAPGIESHRKTKRHIPRSIGIESEDARDRIGEIASDENLAIGLNGKRVGRTDGRDICRK